MSETYTRSTPFELRSTDGDGLTLEGYAAVFGRPATISERGRTFEETIAPGAFKRAIAAKDKVRMLFEHGRHAVLGSMPIGTIEHLAEDSRGLFVRARLIDNWMTRPVRDAVAAGAVDGMSFTFSVDPGGDTWDRSGEIAKRTIHSVRLYELGPVVWPAYSDTTVMVRSACDLLDSDGIAAVIADLRSRQQVVSTTGRSKAQRRAIALAHGLEVA